jgi:hypothetical protein
MEVPPLLDETLYGCGSEDRANNGSRTCSRTDYFGVADFLCDMSRMALAEPYSPINAFLLTRCVDPAGSLLLRKLLEPRQDHAGGSIRRAKMVRRQGLIAVFRVPRRFENPARIVLAGIVHTGDPQ